ncbi:hypothetical protein ACFVGN_02285 [Streptomyces sp. NPDC057757]|uniref:effector-associated constant component EACC1 n=1 Tax=Streptomyces sp. NPDC057757 TaxID=3346241 RepID=UPI00368B46A0
MPITVVGLQPGGAVRIEVRVQGSDDDLRSLYGWLRDEPAVRRTANLELLEQPPRPGEMGGLVDVLQLVTDNGWSAGTFAFTLATWRQTRRRDPGVTVRRGDTVVTLSDCNDAEIQRVIEMLEERRDGEDPGQ